jgi:hypothetical protein
MAFIVQRKKESGIGNMWWWDVGTLFMSIYIYIYNDGTEAGVRA